MNTTNIVLGALIVLWIGGRFLQARAEFIKQTLQETGSDSIIILEENKRIYAADIKTTIIAKACMVIGSCGAGILICSKVMIASAM